VPTTLEIEYWPRLAAPFSRFLRELGEAVANGDSEQPALNRWAAAAAQVADSAARAWLHAIPRHDRMLLQAVTCHEDYQRARQARIRIGPPRQVWRLSCLRTVSEFTSFQCFRIDFLVHSR
jgi:hypothetical protein